MIPYLQGPRSDLDLSHLEIDKTKPKNTLRVVTLLFVLRYCFVCVSIPKEATFFCNTPAASSSCSVEYNYERVMTTRVVVENLLTIASCLFTNAKQ